MHDLLDGREYKYKVGQVVVNVNHSHENKIRILKMQMDNWVHSSTRQNGLLPPGKQYDDDVKRANELFEKLESGVKEHLNKDEMLEMNVLFKRYGGIRKKK